MLHNSASSDDNGYGISRSKHTMITHSDPNLASTAAAAADDNTGFYSNRNSSFSTTRFSAEGSPMMMSPWNSNHHSPWLPSPAVPTGPHTALVGSLVREEGHIYSLATRAGDLLYTGSDSKNIRVWKNLKEFSGFKSASGLVKAIVISNDNNAKGRVRIFSGHQDGKIRVWKVSSKNPTVHRRSGSLPTLRDILKASIKPSNYIEVKRHKSVLWIKHSDAISCLSLDEERGLLYSASWDRSFKVWRISDSKCLESVSAHTDAVNSVVTGAQGLVFTGSADGTVKAWGREEIKGGATKHVLVKTLIKQETAVTALAMDPTREILYCGSSDGLVNFWETDGAELVHGGVLKGHELAVLCVAAKGRLVLSGSADKNICVWRREEGAVHTWMTMLTGHAGPVKCLAVEEEEEVGKLKVYSGSLDKSVKVWSVSEHFDSASESFRSDRSD